MNVAMSPRRTYIVKDKNDSNLSATQKAVKRALKLLEKQLRQEPSALTTPKLVSEYLVLKLAGREHEVFVAIWLDAQHRVVEYEEMFRGTLTQTSVYPREVVKSALSFNAAAVIFAHNHPSGVAEPSHADENLTRTLRNALALVDVRLLDHFIVADNNMMSFAERGLI